jgi:hypothetical protein
VKLAARILLCISVVLLLTHQLMPHDHDEHTELAAHSPFEHNHDFAAHYVDHVFFNNSSQPVIKVCAHYIDSIAPYSFETSLVIHWVKVKRGYENIRPPLITYYYHLPLRAPPPVFN